MTTSLEVLFTPADFAALEGRDLSETVCVVFDVLRATSSIVTALANGASAIFPVAEISQALALRRQEPGMLLAGERDGVRILNHLTGSIPFDLGNSPREFTRAKIAGRPIAMTTTNGTRALRACIRAWATFIGSFLNLRATAELLRQESPAHLVLVCSGTFDQAAYEDVLCAGALCEQIWAIYGPGEVSDSTHMARHLFLEEEKDLARAVASSSRNARRLLANLELSDDVVFCLQRDAFSLVAEMSVDGTIKARSPLLHS